MNTQVITTLPADFPIEAKVKIFTIKEAAELALPQDQGQIDSAAEIREVHRLHASRHSR